MKQKNNIIFQFQLLCNILNRVSSQTSSFQHVVLMAIPDLDKVDHFPILAVVIGILLALLEDEINDVVSTYIDNQIFQFFMFYILILLLRIVHEEVTGKGIIPIVPL